MEISSGVQCIPPHGISHQSTSKHIHRQRLQLIRRYGRYPESIVMLDVY